MAEKLNRIWSKAEPLSLYFERLVSETDFDATAYSETTDSTERLASDNPTMQVPNNLTNALNHSNQIRDHKDAALVTLRNQLIGEDISMVGRIPTSDGNFAYVRLEYEFWIGAKVWPEIDEAQSGDLKVDQLKVVIPVMRSNASPSTIEQQQFKRVPSPKKLRPETIEACFEEKLIDFDDMSLFDRMAIYKKWILATYRINELGPSGFSEKSWQAEETKFKKFNSLIRAKN